MFCNSRLLCFRLSNLCKNFSWFWFPNCLLLNHRRFRHCRRLHLWLLCRFTHWFCWLKYLIWRGFCCHWLGQHRCDWLLRSRCDLLSHLLLFCLPTLLFCFALLLTDNFQLSFLHLNSFLLLELLQLLHLLVHLELLLRGLLSLVVGNVLLAFPAWMFF